jgi:SAM-dependent methyltransferase
MEASYALAYKEIANALIDGGQCLDCGAGAGHSFDRISKLIDFDKSLYHGLEWKYADVQQAQIRHLDVIQSDLNKRLPFDNGQFRCVFGLSVLEHLLNGCAYMRECHRVIQNGGRLILLTPNISTYFTVALLLMGKMPSSGPHPDSNALLAKEEIYKVSDHDLIRDSESETPSTRHLVVFSYRVLRQYLTMIGFVEVYGYGFGLYPFPLFMQTLLERIDPYHCHQMVFVAKK